MERKRFGRWGIRLMMLTLLLTMFSASAAFADQWTESKGSISYLQGKKNKKATGLTTIGNNTFYFDEDGILQTGFVKIEKSVYYFRAKGQLGTKGAMAKGWITLKGTKYYLNPKNGKLVTGLKKIGKYTYFLSTSSKLGVRGSRFVSRTRTYKNKTYYFNAKGRMVTNKWVDNHYYGSDGVMLKNAVTPDGYRVDADGVKGKKVSKKKEVTIDGVTYKYDKKTKAFVVKKTAKVLIIAGHGQGDSGATSALGQESVKTREFASLIYKHLKAIGTVEVTMYDQNYDCYQVLTNPKSDGPNPNFEKYDYVLEIHFDAAGVKDIGGDGKQKGVCMLVSYGKKTADRAIDVKIINSIVKLGFKKFAGGVISDMAMLRHTLFNASTCQRLGVNYGLLETAFIDDADDMRFYNANKNNMAKAVANSIADYFS